MVALKCELCGGNELVKTDGFYVCQHCGTKYDPEEAKRLIVQGKIDISGSTIKIDPSSAEDLGYNLESGRIRAREDEEQRKKAESDKITSRIVGIKYLAYGAVFLFVWIVSRFWLLSIPTVICFLVAFGVLNDSK